MEEDVRVQLFQAIDNGDLETVISCIEENSNLNVQDSNGQTPLILAAEKGHLNIVNELLANNVDTNIRDEDGWTALIAASKEGFVAIITALLEHAAKLNIPDLGSWTPLVWASYKGHCDVIRLLLHYGANPNEQGQHNMTALIWASGRGHADVVQALIQAGAKPEVADKYGTSALIWACRKGHYDVIKVLIAEGANCNTAGTHGWTPLIMAAKGGYTDVVILLLEENPNVNAVDQDGRSSLSWAAKEGYEGIVLKLLSKGAFLNMPDRHGDTPLILASKEVHSHVVRTLIAAYADIEMMDSEGKTALYIAVEKGHVGVVNELLLSGANTEVMNKDGETPLLCGTKKKHTQCVKQLIEKSANVQVADKKGDTALHIAVRNKYAGMCEVLLSDPKTSKLLYRPNKAGETPYSIDTQNKPPILVGIFAGNQICQNDFENMDSANQQELLMTTVADFIVEPSLAIPMTVGMYSKWGTGKSTYMQRLMDLLDNFRDQEPIQPFRITMTGVLLTVIFSVTIGLLMWVAVSWADAIATSACVIVLTLGFLVFARLALVSTNELIHKCGLVVTRFLNRFSWFLKLVYCIPPSLEEMRPMLPVHLITVDLSRSVMVGDNPMTSLVNLTRELNNAIEDDIGIFIPRLYRIFQAGPYRVRAGNSLNLQTRWKMSCCCIPSILISVFVYLCLWITVILYGIYDITGPSTVIAIQIACCCVLGGALLANILRMFVIIYCLVLSMKKRVKLVSTQAGIQEDTFLSVLKQELDMCVDTLGCLDGFAHRQTRIIINIDLLDSLEQQQVLHLINSINLLVTDPGHPFILVLSVDPRLLIKAVEQTLSNIDKPIVGPYDYLKNLIDLPFHVCNQPKLKVDGLIPAEIRNQLVDSAQLLSETDETELEWDENGDMLPSIHDEEDNNGHLPTGNGSVPPLHTERSVKFPSNDNLSYRNNGDRVLNLENENISEDLSHLLRNNENGSLSDVKRIMNVVSLKGRILRNSDITFQWTRLAIWVSLCDGWPYRSSWITLLCLDSELDLPGKLSIKRLHHLFGYAMPLVGEPDLGTDGSLTYFETFIASHKPVVSVSDVRSYSSVMFYTDPTIRKLMVDYLIAVKSDSISKQPSIQHHLSRSTYPTSPCSSKFMWRNAVDDQFLARMTVANIAVQLSDLEGIDEQLLPIYKNRLQENNINGRVLATCDINELRDVMQMTFGDWQLFKAWILTLRKDQGLINNRSIDKASSYRSSSQNNSYHDGSQPESIPSSPKQSLFGGSQKASRLPALNEKPGSGSNAPYATHSPHNSPHQTRKSLKLRKTLNKNSSVSQDSETGSSPPKDQQADPGWHRSADSGFASTDVDPNSRLIQQQQQQQQQQQPKLNEIKRLEDGVNKKAPSIHVEQVSPDKLTADLLFNDTWNVKSNIGFDCIYKTNGELTMQDINLVDEDSRKKWSFAKLSDGEDSVFENGEFAHRNNNLGPYNNNNNSPTLSIDCRTKVRPVSLSEVPLPPLSMLDNSIDWPIVPPVEFDDEVDDSLPSPPPSGTERKIAFQSYSKIRGMSNYATSTESEKQNLLDHKS